MKNECAKLTSFPYFLDPSAPPGLEQQILNPPVANDVQQYNTTVISSTATAAAANNGQYPELHAPPTAAQQLRQALEISQTTSLSAEQSQYFNTLSAQNTGVNAYQTVTGVQYNTGKKDDLILVQKC